MIRHPLGLRLAPDQSVRDQIYEAARIGARGVVIDAIGDVAPHRLGETGRRELRQILRTAELSLAALSLPTRRPFDTLDQLDDRMRRADAAFAMAYELGTTIVLARAGAVPPREDEARLEIFSQTLLELGRRAEHHGVKLAMETGTDSGQTLKEFLDALGSPGLAASIDPAQHIASGDRPDRLCTRARILGCARIRHGRDRLERCQSYEPSRFRLSTRCPRLGRVSGSARGNRISRLFDRLARAWAARGGPVQGGFESAYSSRVTPTDSVSFRRISRCICLTTECLKIKPFRGRERAGCSRGHGFFMSIAPLPSLGQIAL